MLADRARERGCLFGLDSPTIVAVWGLACKRRANRGERVPGAKAPKIWDALMSGINPGPISEAKVGSRRGKKGAGEASEMQIPAG